MSKSLAYKLFTLCVEDEYKNIKEMCRRKLYNQEYDIEHIILMPYLKREQLISLTTPTFLKTINSLDPTMLPEDDYRELIEIIPDNIQNNLEIKVIPNNCWCRCLPITLGSLMFLA